MFNSETGAFDDEQIISTQLSYCVSIFLADLDGNDLIDILAVSQLNHKVVWFKNIDGENFILQNYINDNAQGASSVIAVDIDNDTDLDVVSASKDDAKILFCVCHRSTFDYLAASIFLSFFLYRARFRVLR